MNRVVGCIWLFIGFIASGTTYSMPVVYTVSGSISGNSHNIGNPIDVSDSNFTVSIFADTDNAGHIGGVAGAGSLFANTSDHAIWKIDGFGEATSSLTQIYSMPGIARMGFSWMGTAYPLDSTDHSNLKFDFNAGLFATDVQYGRLYSPVEQIALNLVTSLKNQDGVIPEYTTSINFNDVGPLTITNMSNLSYSVSPVPLPASIWLFLAPITILNFLTKRKCA